jgi:dihydroxyacetone kinase DhaKLM complex PTS-EIIA-like component DhaM
MTVGLILVSHSGPVAQGTADLARQMAPSVTIAAAGGTEDGGIGIWLALMSGHTVTGSDSYAAAA